MTFEEQNESIKAKAYDYPEWKIKDLIQQMHMNNTEVNVYGEMIEFLENILNSRK